MKIAVVSDIHLEFNPYYFPDFIKEHSDVELIIDAGDLHPMERKRNAFIRKVTKRLGVPYFYIQGNHDYYGTKFPSDPYEMTDRMVYKDVTIRGATLWTTMNPMSWLEYTGAMNDSKQIRLLTEEAYMNAHLEHTKFLFDQNEADIIVSHHAPSYKSVHRMYRGDPYNKFYSTELSESILNMERPPKLWIHGHSHTDTDYTIGETRVIAHQRGYPHEANHKGYKPLIIEV